MHAGSGAAKQGLPEAQQRQQQQQQQQRQQQEGDNAEGMLEGMDWHRLLDGLADAPGRQQATYYCFGRT